MIDETKLIEKIKARKEYLQQQAAECDETGDIENMQLWDAKDFEMDIVLRWIAESKSERGEWIKVKYVKEESPDGGFWIYSCSNCYIPNYKNSAYCPHCGARMEVEDETV